jgi:hypothetical protein
VFFSDVHGESSSVDVFLILLADLPCVWREGFRIGGPLGWFGGLLVFFSLLWGGFLLLFLLVLAVVGLRHPLSKEQAGHLKRRRVDLGDSRPPGDVRQEPIQFLLYIVFIKLKISILFRFSLQELHELLLLFVYLLFRFLFLPTQELTVFV